MTRSIPARERRRPGLAAAALAAFVLGACAHRGSPSGAEAEPPPEPTGARYLKDGPTVQLETEAVQEPHGTLERLERQMQEAAALKSRIADLEDALARAQEAARLQAGREQAAVAESQRMRQILEDGLEDQKVLTEQLLEARIARLRTEQEMLRLKIAELVKTGP